MWYKKSKKFLEGVQLISSKIPNDIFNRILENVYEYLKIPKEDDIVDYFSSSIGGYNYLESELSQDELVLINRSILYLIQRLSIFIISPTKLQNDLKELCFCKEKINLVLVFYTKLSCDFVKDLCFEKRNKSLSVQWKEKSIIASDEICNVKSKQAKADVLIQHGANNILQAELDSEELEKLYRSFETIQRELDSLQIEK